MFRSRALARLGAVVCSVSLLSGCASFPSMSVSSANGGSTRPPKDSTTSGQIPRPQAQVTQIPRYGAGGPRQGPPEATAAQIADLVPDEPIGITVTPQAVPQFLNTVFTDVLRVPYSLGPNVALRTEVLGVNAPTTLSKRAYVSVLQVALRAYGLTLSAQGRGFQITEEGGPGGASATTVIRSRSSADTPLNARSVTQYFQLVALQADAVQPLVSSLLQGRVALSVDSAANALVLQGAGRNVAQAVDILRNLDQPAFAGSQVIRLEPVFWSADNFATALQNTLAAEGYVVSTDPLGPKSILILPLTATNQTLAFAADNATMERVRYWARELDQPSALGDQNTTFVYEVRNTSAAALGQMLISAGGTTARLAGLGPGGVQQVIQQLGGPAAQALQAGRGGQGGGGRGAQAQLQQLQQGGRGGGGAVGQAGANRGGVGINGAQNATATLAPFGGAIPGGGGITVDDAGNRILFTGTATQFAQLRTLLQQLDAPARQVRVEVTVAEVTLTDATRVGLEWFFNGVKNGDGFAGGTQTQSGVSGLGIGPDGLTLGFIRTDASGAIDFKASFNAFASNNKVNILSNPSLTTRSGSPGSIQVGADVPFIQQQRAANTGTTTNLDVIQTVSYRQTGVIMQITPVVYGDDRVDLNVYQEVSSDRVNPNRDITSPIFDTRVVTTTLSLADGETAVLGGLIEDNYSKGNNGVPFLKDLPILGQAFRTDTVQGRKTELVVLLTPFIIHDSDEMKSVTNQMTDQINRAFQVGRGGSYTLTPWGAGLAVGVHPPDPKVKQDFARPAPTTKATPAPPAAAVPATIPPAQVPAAPGSGGSGSAVPAAPPPSAPAPSPPARR